MYRPFDGKKISGALENHVKVAGDRSAPPTKIWNLWYLALWGWKTVVVFAVSEEDAQRGYRVGYHPFNGKTMLQSEVSHEKFFAMKIGHEDCEFFAVNADATAEIKLLQIKRTTVSDLAGTKLF